MDRILEKAALVYLFIKIHFLKYFYKWLVNPFINQEELYNYYRKQLATIANSFDIVKINDFGVVLHAPEGKVNMNFYFLKEKDAMILLYDIVLGFNLYRNLLNNNGFLNLLDLLDNFFTLYVEKYDAVMENFIYTIVSRLPFIPNIHSGYKTKKLYLRFILTYLFYFEHFPETEMKKIPSSYKDEDFYIEICKYLGLLIEKMNKNYKIDILPLEYRNIEFYKKVMDEYPNTTSLFKNDIRKIQLKIFSNDTN